MHPVDNTKNNTVDSLATADNNFLIAVILKADNCLV
jgi:hypothetical protein